MVCGFCFSQKAMSLLVCRTSGTLDGHDSRLDGNLDYRCVSVVLGNKFAVRSKLRREFVVGNFRYHCQSFGVGFPNAISLFVFQFNIFRCIVGLAGIKISNFENTADNLDSLFFGIDQSKKLVRTPLGDFKDLLRMNVLHPAGCELGMSGGEEIVVGRRLRSRQIVGEIVWAGKVLGLASREHRNCGWPRLSRESRWWGAKRAT